MWLASHVSSVRPPRDHDVFSGLLIHRLHRSFELGSTVPCSGDPACPGAFTVESLRLDESIRKIGPIALAERPTTPARTRRRRRHSPISSRSAAVGPERGARTKGTITCSPTISSPPGTARRSFTPRPTWRNTQGARPLRGSSPAARASTSRTATAPGCSTPSPVSTASMSAMAGPRSPRRSPIRRVSWPTIMPMSGTGPRRRSPWPK